MALSQEAKLRLRVATAQVVAGDEISSAIDSNSTATASNSTAVALVANGVHDVALAANTEISTADAGALSITKLQSNISSTGAHSRTLAAPSTSGRVKIIEMTVDGGDVTVALTNVAGARAANGDAAVTTATFSAVGHSLILVSAGSKWVYVGGSAACT